MVPEPSFGVVRRVDPECHRRSKLATGSAIFGIDLYLLAEGSSPSHLSDLGYLLKRGISSDRSAPNLDKELLHSPSLSAKKTQ